MYGPRNCISHLRRDRPPRDVRAGNPDLPLVQESPCPRKRPPRPCRETSPDPLCHFRDCSPPGRPPPDQRVGFPAVAPGRLVLPRPVVARLTSSYRTWNSSLEDRAARTPSDGENPHAPSSSAASCRYAPPPSRLSTVRRIAEDLPPAERAESGRSGCRRDR